MVGGALRLKLAETRLKFQGYWDCLLFINSVLRKVALLRSKKLPLKLAETIKQEFRDNWIANFRNPLLPRVLRSKEPPIKTGGGKTEVSGPIRDIKKFRKPCFCDRWP
jgi:hypothetical protein